MAPAVKTKVKDAADTIPSSAKPFAMVSGGTSSGSLLTKKSMPAAMIEALAKVPANTPLVAS